MLSLTVSSNNFDFEFGATERDFTSRGKCNVILLKEKNCESLVPIKLSKLKEGRPLSVMVSSSATTFHQ